ncbi:nuclear transport factor 2 family protein, partial [Nonomuraea sp. RK-328]|nr:nuclear transport factor 2 family protein [Nonomuraea sp. RK-328]
MAALVATGDVEALAPLLSEDFVHHRPDATFATKAEWLDDLSIALIPLADQQVEIRHLLADGDHVVIHSQRRLPGGGPEIAVVDIWRLH